MTDRAMLALDQSLSSTGFALLDGPDLTTGSWPLCEGIGQRAQAFRVLFHHLDALNRQCGGLAEIVHEEVVLKPTDKRDKCVALFGLVAIIELFGVSRGIEVTAYPSDKWRATAFSDEERKHFRGKDWKRPAIERCRQLGRDPNTDDEAEAFLLLDHHLNCRRIMPTWRELHPFLETLA